MLFTLGSVCRSIYHLRIFVVDDNNNIVLDFSGSTVNEGSYTAFILKYDDTRVSRRGDRENLELFREHDNQLWSRV